MDEVYHRFGIRVCIKINNRKILSGIAEIIGELKKLVDITVAIDKLDKIGLENVNKELGEKGISPNAIERLQPIILLNGSNREKLHILKQELINSDIGMKGIEELEIIFDKIDLLGIRSELELDLTLARGLNYYTGAIFEVKALDVQIGSITGGGRYDNLTGVFGMPEVSGVGISFGADRIFDVLNQLDLYPEDTTQSTQVILLNLEDVNENNLLISLSQLREQGIRTEIYPDKAKFNKQMTYARNNKIPYVIIIDKEDIIQNRIRVKHTVTEEQKNYRDIPDFLKQTGISSILTHEKT
jgi:histidyl-tRNA synthetase